MQTRGSNVRLSAWAPGQRLDGEGSDGRYRNTAETEAFLDKQSPTYIGGLLEMFNARLYRF